MCISAGPRGVLLGREFGLSEVSAGDVKHAPYTRTAIHKNKGKSEQIIRSEAKGMRAFVWSPPCCTSRYCCTAVLYIRVARYEYDMRRAES